MTSIRRPARTLLVATLVAWPVAASAQFGQAIRQELRQAETNLVPQNRPVAGTSIQNGQPIPTTVVPSNPATMAVVAPSNTIGSHQIDRYEAIRQLQADLKSDGNNLANWAILGELAHEVAVELPEGQDDAYYRLSREAYERAAQLDPNNNGLRSAVQFAREQETNAAAFDARRRQGVSTYLDARRREMAQAGVNPTVMVYESAPTMTTTATYPPQQPGVAAAQPYGANYPTPTYRPYYNQQAQQPYSYNQYSNGYTPATPTTAANGTPAAAPVTLRQYGQQLPGVIINQGVQSLGRPR